MEIMKKNIYLAAILCGLVGVFSSCSDDDKKGEAATTDSEKSYKPVVYMRDADVREVNMQDFGADAVFTTSVCRKGNSVSTEAVDAELVVMTEDEMYYYNKVYGKSFSMLPEHCYEYRKEYTFSGSEEVHEVKITLKKEIFNSDNSQKYALPLRLISKNGTVDEDQEVLIVAADVIVPEIKLEKSGKQEVLDLSGVNPTDIVNVDIPVSMFGENEGWEFSTEFETDPKKLKNLVSYCPADGIEYSLLGTDYYEMESKIDFSGDEREKTLSVKIKRGDLETGNYLLPIALTGVQGMPFKYSREICFVHVYLNNEFPQIDIKNKLVTNGDTKEEGSELSRVTDSNTNTFWQSPWHSSYWLTGKVTCDPEYGIYIDVNVSITKGMQVKIATKTGHNYPVLWRLYGKKTGSEEWTMLKEYSDTFNNTPISFKTEKFYGSYSAVRVAFLKSKDGNTDLRNITLSGGYCKNVSIAELELFGL